MGSFQRENKVPGKRATAVAIAAYKAVKPDAVENLVVIAGAGDDITGFTNENGVAASAPAEISGQGGGALATAGGAISEGDRLKVDANGDLVLAAGAGDLSVAVARADAADNDIFAVYVETLRIHA